MPERAPVSPDGWNVYKHTYDGEPPKRMVKSHSLDWCAQYITNWKTNSLGTAELYIEPVNGWESIKADPFAAIPWAVHAGYCSVELAAIQIRAIAEQVAERLPVEALVGLARYYAAAAIESLGGDEKLESAEAALQERQSQLVVESDDKPIPF